MTAPPLVIPSGSRAQGKTYQTAENIADYLIANGVILPPCKVGDKVFEIKKTCFECPYCKDDYANWCECALDDNKTMFETDYDKDCIYEIRETKFIYNMIEQVGKTVFVSREDAEKALKERANT